jgi:hypothetical protein
VGFLGDIKHGRRADILDLLEERLKQKGIALKRVVSDCHGEERTNWLNRTRILINLHNFPWNPAWIRFLMAASCGTLVVSEPMNDDHPMTNGVHYISATADEMPDTIANLLGEPDKISRITSAASALCRDELTLLKEVKCMIECVESTPAVPCLS